MGAYRESEAIAGPSLLGPERVPGEREHLAFTLAARAVEEARALAGSERDREVAHDPVAHDPVAQDRVAQDRAAGNRAEVSAAEVPTPGQTAARDSSARDQVAEEAPGVAMAPTTTLQVPAEPPAEVTALLGPPPSDPDHREVWDTAARALHEHRPGPGPEAERLSIGLPEAERPGPGSSPWREGLGFEPFEARDPATRAVVETVARTREVLGLAPLPEPGLEAALLTPATSPATTALLGPPSPALVREALARPETRVEFATGVSRALSDADGVGPPPTAGPERLVWARSAAAVLASDRGLAGPEDLEARRELGLTALREGSGQLTRWAWDHELHRLGPWPTEAVQALSAEDSALRAGLAGLGQAPQDPRRYLEDVRVEEVRLSTNLARARTD
ncbi:MAG: hypothetical protein ACRDZY_14065, partial [Acidimicrobiales bacterium]